MSVREQLLAHVVARSSESAQGIETVKRVKLAKINEAKKRALPKWMYECRSANACPHRQEVVRVPNAPNNAPIR
jgi:hypothetical protein